MDGKQPSGKIKVLYDSAVQKLLDSDEAGLSLLDAANKSEWHNITTPEAPAALLRLARHPGKLQYPNISQKVKHRIQVASQPQSSCCDARHRADSSKNGECARITVVVGSLFGIAFHSPRWAQQVCIRLPPPFPAAMPHGDGSYDALMRICSICLLPLERARSPFEGRSLGPSYNRRFPLRPSAPARAAD